MYSRILVPLDGSKLAEKALPHAQGLAKTSGATIHFIRVFTRHPSGGNPAGPGLDASQSTAATAELARQLEEAQIGEALAYLDELSRKLTSEGIQTVTELHEGSSHEHIIDYAKQHGIDLIVMSPHGHGGLKRLLVGSTTDRVIRAGEIPVLVVP